MNCFSAVSHNRNMQSPRALYAQCTIKWKFEFAAPPSDLAPQITHPTSLLWQRIISQVRNFFGAAATEHFHSALPSFVRLYVSNALVTSEACKSFVSALSGQITEFGLADGGVLWCGDAGTPLSIQMMWIAVDDE